MTFIGIGNTRCEKAVYAAEQVWSVTISCPIANSDCEGIGTRTEGKFAVPTKYPGDHDIFSFTTRYIDLQGWILETQ